MEEPKLEYRIWRHGATWHWQVMAPSKIVLASGVGKESAEARAAALGYCLDHPGNHKGPASLV